jgi:acid phosphatase
MKSLFLAASLAFLPAFSQALPRPDHVVVVIEENHGFSQIIGNKDCPTFNAWASEGALLTHYSAISHPSQPNYLALFAGDTFGSKDDVCPIPGSPFTTPNLYTALKAVGVDFVGYSEDQPAAGSTDCKAGGKMGYRRKHNPWANFGNVPAEASLPFSAFPKDFTKLPAMAIVVPNLENDMHDGTPAQADAWLTKELGDYALWCASHKSLLIVTFDEDNGAEENRVPTNPASTGRKWTTTASCAPSADSMAPWRRATRPRPRAWRPRSAESGPWRNHAAGCYNQHHAPP